LGLLTEIPRFLNDIMALASDRRFLLLADNSKFLNDINVVQSDRRF